MTHTAIPSLMLVLVSIATSVAQPTTSRWHEASMEVGDVTRWYRVYVPEQLDDPAPVVMLLHGGTQSMRKIFKPLAGGTRQWPLIADREHILLVVPNGTDPSSGDARGDRQNWNDLRADGMRNSTADDVAFLDALVDEVGKTYSLDRQRVYLTGASNGGMMTQRMLIEAPQRFAAGVSFIANLPATAKLPNRLRNPRSLMIVNGTRDRLMKPDGGEVGMRGGKVRSSFDTVQAWIALNRADESKKTVETLPDADPDDGCRASKTTYPAKSSGAIVVFVEIDGGGHAMPSLAHDIPDSRLVQRLIGPVCKDLEGAELAWEFLKSRSL